MTTFYLQGLGAENVTFCLHKTILTRWPSAEFILHDPTRDMFEVDKLNYKEMVFITSAHPYYDEYFINRNYHTKFSFLNPVQLIQSRKPKLSIFIPHDLFEPIKFAESPSLRFFDIVCATDDRFAMFRRDVNELLYTGWIKYSPMYYEYYPIPEKILSDFPHQDFNTVFFISNFEMQRKAGFASFYQLFEPIFRMKIPVKLPDWPGVEVFEDYLSSKGVIVIPSRVSSTALLMKTQSVIVNANSSLVTEAYFMHKQVINIIEGYQDEECARLENRHMPSIIHMHSSELTNVDITDLISNMKITNTLPYQIHPFNPDLLVNSISKYIS